MAASPHRKPRHARAGSEDSQDSFDRLGCKRAEKVLAKLWLVLAKDLQQK